MSTTIPVNDNQPPRLHQSTAKILLEKSPAHAILARQKRQEEDEETTAALSKGSTVDAFVFNVGVDRIIPIEADSYRTKAAQEAKAAALAEGKVPVLASEYERLQKVAKVIRLDLGRRGLDLSKGQSQLNLKWDAPNGCPCEGTLDHLFDGGIILDLKTIVLASEQGISNNFVKYGYDVQRAAYTEAVETLYPAHKGRTRFLFYFTETDEPYGSRLVECSGSMKYLGNLKWLRATRAWKKCIDSGVWPGYPSDTFLIEPKPWQMDIPADSAGGE